MKVLTRRIDSTGDINHSHRRLNIFGDARFWFCPKPNHFCPNFAQIEPNLPKSNQFSPKKLARGCGCILCIHSSYGTESIRLEQAEYVIVIVKVANLGSPSN